MYVPLFGYEAVALVPSSLVPLPKSHFALRFGLLAVKFMILALSADGSNMNAASASLGPSPRVNVSSSPVELDATCGKIDQAFVELIG